MEMRGGVAYEENTDEVHIEIKGVTKKMSLAHNLKVSFLTNGMSWGCRGRIVVDQQTTTVIVHDFFLDTLSRLLST